MGSHMASGERTKALVTWIYSEGDMQKIKESRTIFFLYAPDKGDEPTMLWEGWPQRAICLSGLTSGKKLGGLTDKAL